MDEWSCNVVWMRGSGDVVWMNGQVVWMRGPGRVIIIRDDKFPGSSGFP